MYTIVAERKIRRQIAKDKLLEQVKQITAAAMKSGRGTGWKYSTPRIEIIQSGDLYTYRARINFSTTSRRESLITKWPKIVQAFALKGASSGLKACPWEVVEPKGHKEVADTARKEHASTQTIREKANSPKELGDITLDPGSHFSRIYAREAQITRILGALDLAKRTEFVKRTHSVLDGDPGCHAKGTLVLMADGRAVPVEEVKVGDKLLHPDGVRSVLELVRGIGSLYEVIPVKGDPFVVNEDHLLTLVRSKGQTKGSLIDVSVKEWLSWTASRKAKYKLIRSGEVEFTRQVEELKIPPYALGLMLGDGSLVKFPRITSHEADFPYIPEVTYLAEQFGLTPNVYLTEGKSGFVIDVSLTRGHGHNRTKNPLMTALHELGLADTDSESKFIPDRYKFSSPRDRLELLAGYIDTDADCHGGVACITTKSKRLADDTAFVARSLGFAAYLSKKYVEYEGEEKLYYCVNISGNLSKIPCRLMRKQFAERRQIKNVLHTGFDVELVGSGDFYGFKVDGDRRYLMGDFTITHNCGKTEIMRATAQMLGQENHHWMWFDATSMTKAGVIEQLINSEYVPPVLFIEEIEKCDENSLRWLLGVMDIRGQVRRTNYRVGNQAKEVRMVVIATANDVNLLKGLMSGALYSRFANKIYCPRPDREIMRRILEREIDEIKGKPEWIEPTLRFAFDKWGMTDPRDIITICSCGGDLLLSGKYQEDYEATMHPEEKESLLKAKEKAEKQAT